MNSPFKVDFATWHVKRSHPRPRRGDYRAHYVDLADRTLAAIFTHRMFIAKCVAVGFVFACISLPLIPRRYSAEALIYPDLHSIDQDKAVTRASIDGAAIVTGEARAIRSDEILRAVATRLAHDREEAESRAWPMLPLGWLRATWLPETLNHSSIDRAVARLRNKLVVMNDTRSYLISVSFTASSAEEAARVVNAVVTEYLCDKSRQRRLSKVISAEVSLREQLAVYGHKHPKTLQAVSELEAERASLETAMGPQNCGRFMVGNEQLIKLAVPNHTPTNPKGFVIFGLSLVLALMVGIGVAVRRDRGVSENKQAFDYQPHSR